MSKNEIDIINTMSREELADTYEIRIIKHPVGQRGVAIYIGGHVSDAQLIPVIAKRYMNLRESPVDIDNLFGSLCGARLYEFYKSIYLPR